MVIRFPIEGEEEEGTKGGRGEKVGNRRVIGEYHWLDFTMQKENGGLVAVWLWSFYLFPFWKRDEVPASTRMRMAAQDTHVITQGTTTSSKHIDYHTLCCVAGLFICHHSISSHKQYETHQLIFIHLLITPLNIFIVNDITIHACALSRLWSY